MSYAQKRKAAYHTASTISITSALDYNYQDPYDSCWPLIIRERRCFQAIRIVENIINHIKRNLRFFLLFVEDAETQFLRVIESKPANWFPIIVVEQDRAVALSISNSNAL